MFFAGLRLGLSATPKRFDGKELLIQAHIGPVAIQANTILLKPRVGTYISPWRCPRTYRGGINVKMPHTAGKCGHVITDITKHEGRNALIVKKILACYNAGRKTVIFSDRIAHLELMRNTVCQAGVPVKDADLYISGKTKKELERTKIKPLIFATYGMMAEGTDIPWWDCCVLAAPRAAGKQAVGRILREYEGKPSPVVIDILDYDSPVFERYAASREWFYREVGADVIRY